MTTDWIAQLRIPAARQADAPPVARWRYRLAGHTLACDVILPDLEPFAVASHPLEAPRAKLPTTSPLEEHQATGFVDGQRREVLARWWDERVTLTCEETVLALAFSQPGTVHTLASGRLPASALLLGPGLPLLLFARGLLCLHASAVAQGGAAVLFLGDSGRGKSTLAARLGAPRLADDIVPCSGEAGGIQVLPHFPQLKLPWHDPKVPERLPLRALIELEPGKGVKRSFERLAPLAATKTLLSHTVASRLFSQPWMALHLELASAWSAQIEAYRFRFPWGAEEIQRNLEAVRDGISRLQ